MKLISFVCVLFTLLFSLPTLAIDANIAAFQRGDFEQAVRDLELARTSVNPKQETGHYIDISVRLAITYQALGFLQQAKNLLHSLESLVRRLNEPVRHAIILAHLSDVYLAMGRSQEDTCMTQKASQENALKYINHALKIAKLSHDKRLLANLLNKQGNLLMAQGDMAQGDYQEALSVYQQSVQLAEQLGDNAFSSKIWINIAQAIVQSDDYETVEQQFNQSVFDIFATTFQQIQALPDFHDKAFLLIGLAQFITQLLNQFHSQPKPQQKNNHLNDFSSNRNQILLHARGNLLPKHFFKLQDQEGLFRQPLPHQQASQLHRYAYQALTQAFDIAKRNQDARSMSYAVGYLGQLYEDAHRYDDAIQLTRQAIFYAQHRYYYPQLLYRWQWQLGRLFKAQNLRQKAINAYQQAVKHLESEKVRDSLKGGYRNISQSFRETTGALYFQLANLLLLQASQATDTKPQLLNKAKEAIERFKEAELQDYFRDECLLERHRIYAKSNVGQTLPPQTAVLYPILLNNRIELLLSLPGEVQQFTVPNISFNRLTDEVKKFRHQLARKDKIQHHAKQLYDWLIEPVIDTLEQQLVKTLIIVPDGILLTVPFAALYDDSKYLIEQYAIVVTPTLDMYDLTPMPRDNIRILLGGYSKAANYESKGLSFKSLPNVRHELKDIRTKLRNTQFELTLLKEDDFTLSKLTANLENSRKNPYTIIHFATHGHFASQPNNSFLVSADKEPMTMNQLKQLIGMTELKKPVELLVLSACQTAKGNDRAALGLAGVALKAGARSAVASLWLVDDAATAQLMSHFYNYLKNNTLSKAQALQQAQQELLKTSNSHPYYWSAFLLIGNWL